MKVSSAVLKGGSGGNVVSPTWRYIDPIVGRFVSEDPSENQQNWFEDSSDSPILTVDETGRFTDSLFWPENILEARCLALEAEAEIFFQEAKSHMKTAGMDYASALQTESQAIAAEANHDDFMAGIWREQYAKQIAAADTEFTMAIELYNLSWDLRIEAEMIC